MLIRKIIDKGLSNCKLLTPRVLNTHTSTCPTAKGPVCPGTGRKDDGAASGLIKRAEQPGKCRYGFVPEEWFLFFYSKTGVSGPYLLALGLGNYLLSKEIYVLEHEYYSGLPWIVVIYIVSKKLGPKLAETLDKQVDEIADGWENGRREEIAFYEQEIKSAQDAQWRAEGQKLLMDAKKENIAMQLEAAYRERSMHVYQSVKGRMDYHVKKYRAEARIHQKWMIEWILENVYKSITVEFQQQAMDSAIRDLSVAASGST